MILWPVLPPTSASAWILNGRRRLMHFGMNLSTAFNIFIRQSLREGGIPFGICLNPPTKETFAAMLEAEKSGKDPSVKGYTDLDEMFAHLKK